MKKNFIKTFAACSAICIAAACAKDIPAVPSEEKTEPQTPEVQYETMVISGNLSATKTVLGADGKSVNWKKGDMLSVFSCNAAAPANHQFTTELSADSHDADFSGKIEDITTSFVALYPYDAAAIYTDGSITTTLKATQNTTVGSFDNGASITLANGSRTPGQTKVEALTFSNLCSVLSFKLPANITFANKITVTSKSGAKMAGNIAISCGETPAITSASESSVVLNGKFTADKTYYVTVAPGTYENGFTFLIETEGGNSYTRETTKTIPAEAGNIYPLGTLSLVLANPSATASITHTYSSNTLTGSDAALNISGIPAEFGPAISVTASLKKGATVVRSYTGAPGTGIRMNVENGYVYLPKGSDYTLEVSYSNGSSKTYAVSATNPASPAPDGSKFTLVAKLDGYTSYSCYKGTDGQSASASTANSKDNATIYGIGASYQSGLSTEVYNQCSSTLLSVSGATLDGAAASGDKGGQSWAAHTIGATLSFDGVSFPQSKTVYVTGLPYSYEFPNDENKVKNEGWIGSGEYGKGGYQYYIADGKKSGAIKKMFYTPDNINISANFHIKYYATTTTDKMTTYVGTVNSSATSVLDNPIEDSTHNALAPLDKGSFNRTSEHTLTVSTPYLMIYGIRTYHKSAVSNKVWIWSTNISYK